ncbi:serine hydrolase [Streptococcus didelphis]|uniref:Serine hydrolase n=2 Tax=Streptococcus didelphis TaxID=102886 RepID=A0ABY9LGL7_9STRE|nr:serine hydrolase [Streptococcus didelphis]WMB28002.1 serine hydrolase [Streptococcus didelphis]
MAQETDNILSITRNAGYTVEDINKPKSSIVVNAENGDILWQDNINLLRDPASMSKMFTLFLLFEDISKGKVNLDTTITATETDQAISKIYEISNNKITPGVAYPVRDLIYMTAIPSSNVATIMLANYLSNNDASAFIKRINDTAKRLGMTKTHFNNASGAAAVAFNGYYKPDKYDPTAPNQTTSRDLAVLMYHFVKEYPDILTYTKPTVIKTMVGTPYEEEFHSYNHSLMGEQYGMEGVDGFKTGSSPSAAFNAMVTAQRNGKRLITIVMGIGDWSDQNGEFYRHPFINALTEKGFLDLTKKKKQKLDNLFPKQSSDLQSAKPKTHATKNKQMSLLAKVEYFVNHHHHLIFMCLALFIFIVLLLAIFAIVS